MRRSRSSRPPLACGLSLMRRPGRRGERGQLGDQPALGVEQLLGPVASQPPARASARCAGLRGRVGDRHLVRTEGALVRHAVDGLPGRSSPWACASTIIGQGRRDAVAALARVALDRPDLGDRGRPARRPSLRASQPGSWPSTKSGLPAVAAQQLLELVAPDPRQQGRVGDLVAVQVQDRQHGAVVHRIEELVRMPGGRQRPGLGLAVADDAGDDQSRGCRTPRRTNGSTSSPIRRPRGSSRGIRARRGSGCRRETRTAGTACAGRPRPG